jgi:hypothetical protein
MGGVDKTDHPGRAVHIQIPWLIAWQIPWVESSCRLK